MNRTEKRSYTIRRVKVKDIDIKDLTDVEMQSIIQDMENELESISVNADIISTPDLFAYVALSYAISLYRTKHLENTKQKAEEKRLDETLKRLENYLKNP